jgi:hypothetical protein
MGDRRPAGEKEYSPLDDSSDLIRRVLSVTAAAEEPMLPAASVKEEKVVHMAIAEKSPLSKPPPPRKELEQRAPEARPAQRDEFLTFKFKVPRSDYAHAKRILSLLEEELGARIDLANLGRGWLTRFITAEKEILEAARHQERLKTPNPRNPLEVAEVDHAMTVIQSVAFRRAATVK